MKYNLLVVTDHRTHTATNSLYQLVRAIRKDDRSGEMWVCSRGLSKNNSFFNGEPLAPIFGMRVEENFGYDESGTSIWEHAHELNRELVHAILVRMPQPFDSAFLFSLESIVPPHRIINRPDGIVETATKAFLMDVSYLCQEPFICQYMGQALEYSQHRELVLKPFHSYGGRGLVRLSSTHCWNEDHMLPIDQLNSFLREEDFPMLGMPFLKNVTLGDKRIIVANGKIMGAALRMPKPGSWMCNVAQGGHAAAATPDEDELIIENTLTPLLYRKGIILYGFDTLVNDEGRRVLSEINTLSIGGLVPLEELTRKPLLREIAQRLWDYIEGKHYWEHSR